jgi:hypothetical protein
VRGKAIIVGGIGVLVAAALSVNAQTGNQRTTTASLASLVAARTQVATAEREITIAGRSTATEPASKSESEPAEKPDVDTKPAAPKVTISAACQQAIANLKALHQADVAEDATERSGLQPVSAASLAAARAEEVIEVQQWRTALLAARTACVPQPTAACRAAINGLQAQLQSLHTVGLDQLRAISERNWAGNLASVRTAFSAVATACANRE